MTILASIDLQTLGDAFGQGAIYALMAVGIGLVFGVLRLVNFAYGQLIMAGAYTLAYTSGWPVAASIVSCFAVVVALSLAMDRLVFRPLRSSSPAVMLVTTFAIAFLLQAVALIIDLRDGQLGQVASSIAPLNQAVSVGGVDVRKVTFVAVGVAVGALITLALVLTRTTIGLHTRAAASDFRTARLLGVRANRVIAFAVVVSGLLAGAVAVLLTVQNPFDFGTISGEPSPSKTRSSSSSVLSSAGSTASGRRRSAASRSASSPSSSMPRFPRTRRSSCRRSSTRW